MIAFPARTSVLLPAGASVTAEQLAPLGAVQAPASSRETPPEPGELYSRLIEQVHVAVDNGANVPCVGSDAGEWTSDDPADQERAADHCWDCPLVFQCRAYAIAAGESAGVWGGFAPELERARSRRYRPSVEAKQRAKERRRALRAARKAEAAQRDCADAYAYILMEGGADKPQIREKIGYLAMNTKATATEIPANTCACGNCHQQVGPKAMYKPGHDAAHVSHLLQALTNSYADGQPVTKATINGLAKELPSEPLRNKFQRAAARLIAKHEAEAKAAAK
jgi:hypothetical protein